MSELVLCDQCDDPYCESSEWVCEWCYEDVDECICEVGDSYEPDCWD